MMPHKVNAPVRTAASAALVALSLATVGSALAGAAFGQTPPAIPAPAPTSAAMLAADIERDGSCLADQSLADVRKQLLLSTSVSSADIGRALALVSASPTACAPIKAAATTLAEAYPQPVGTAPVVAAADADQVSPTATTDPAADAALAAEGLKFIVGPPPRHMTKGRNAGG